MQSQEETLTTTSGESKIVDVTTPRPRPNAKWQCGYADLGHPCAAGPTGSGICAFHKAKNHDADASGVANVDTDSGLKSGNTCEHLVEEYGPCIPKSNAWFSRQTIALNLAILVGGVLLLFMVIPQKEQVFVPGGLSSKHSQILSNTLLSERCSLCHENTHADMAVGKIQDDLCMNCHESHMPDALLGMAHDLNVQQLAALDSSKGKSVRFVSLPSDSGSPNAAAHQTRQTFCADCHIEHHGSEHDLKAMTDRRCQSCHREQFESFSKGHPDFEHYPYRTQRRIAFDHSVHQSKYFAQKNESFACSRCHVDGDRTGKVGSVFRSVGFEAACASCHSESIQSSAMNGWALLQTPCITPEDQQNATLELGYWPKSAVFDYDGEITMAARMLLGGDRDLRDAWIDLPASGKIAKVSVERRAEVAQALARAFRRLVREVAAEGQAAWERRLASTLQHQLGREMNDHEARLIREVSAGLPPDLFRQIDRDWFGGESPSDQTAFQSSFRSADHRSKAPVRMVAASPDFLLVNGNHDDDTLDLLESESDDQLLGGFDSSKVAQPKIEKLAGSKHVASGGWFLDHDVLAIRYVPRGHGDPFLAAWTELLIIAARADPATESIIPQGATPKQIVPGVCTECHLVGEHHSPRELWGNWRAAARPASTKLFTKFDHTPHLTLPTLTGCKYCHVLKSEWNESSGELMSTLKAVYESSTIEQDTQLSKMIGTTNDAHALLGDEFLEMSKSQCATCHHAGSANQGCTQCHNYHVGSAGLEWSHGYEHRQ